MTCMSTCTQLLTSTLTSLRWKLLPVLRCLFSCMLQERIKAAEAAACRWTHFLNKKKVLSSQSPSTVSLQSWIGAGWTCRHVENIRVYLWTLGVHDCTYVCPCAFGPCAMRIFQGFSQGHALLWMVATGCVTHLVSGWHSHEYTSTAP